MTIARKQELECLKQALMAKDKEIATMRCVVDNLPGSIYWKDKNGTYLGRNQYSGESMRSQGYPWRWKDIVGKTDYDLFPKEMAEQFRQNDLEVIPPPFPHLFYVKRVLK